MEVCAVDLMVRSGDGGGDGGGSGSGGGGGGREGQADVTYVHCSEASTE